MVNAMGMGVGLTAYSRTQSSFVKIGKRDHLCGIKEQPMAEWLVNVSLSVSP